MATIFITFLLEYNLTEPEYNLTEPEYNLTEPEYNLPEPEYNLPEHTAIQNHRRGCRRVSNFCMAS